MLRIDVSALHTFTQLFYNKIVLSDVAAVVPGLHENQYKSFV